MQDHGLLTIILLLATGVLLVGFLRHLRLPAVFAYLLTGVILGPHALAVVPDLASTRQLAAFGVVFLMFTIGLEFSLAQFLSMRLHGKRRRHPSDVCSLSVEEKPLPPCSRQFPDR